MYHQDTKSSKRRKNLFFLFSMNPPVRCNVGLTKIVFWAIWLYLDLSRKIFSTALLIFLVFLLSPSASIRKQRTSKLWKAETPIICQWKIKKDRFLDRVVLNWSIDFVRETFWYCKNTFHKNAKNIAVKNSKLLKNWVFSDKQIHLGTAASPISLEHFIAIYFLSIPFQKSTICTAWAQF